MSSNDSRWLPSWHEGSASGPPALEFGTEPQYLDPEMDAWHDGHAGSDERVSVRAVSSRESNSSTLSIDQQYFGGHAGFEVSDQQRFHDYHSSFGIDGRLPSMQGDVVVPSASEDHHHDSQMQYEYMHHQSYQHEDLDESNHDDSGNHDHDVGDNQIDFWHPISAAEDVAARDREPSSLPIAVTASEARAHALWLIDTSVDSWWSDDDADAGQCHVHQFPSFRLSNTEFKCVDLYDPSFEPAELLCYMIKAHENMLCILAAAR